MSLDPKERVNVQLSGRPRFTVDFGTSKSAMSDVSSQMTKGIGTPIFMAPEILEGVTGRSNTPE